jgi:hypothetical protein
MTAAKRFGLNSAFLAYNAIFFSSRAQPKFTVLTIFCKVGCKCESLTDAKFIEGVAGPCAEKGVANMGKLNMEPLKGSEPVIELLLA